MLGILLGMLAGVAMPGLQPFGRQLEYAANETLPNALPSIAELTDLHYKGILDKPQYISLAAKLGYSEGTALGFLDSAQNLLTAGDYIAAWRREIIPEEKLNDKLKSIHYTDDEIEIIKKTTEFFPTAADLVRWAVREVYSPEIVTAFQTDESLPEQFITEASKIGVSEEQARNYWRAHWDLPSITDGFEMLHRREINEDQLDVLLRTQDVMPFWREKLKKIAYIPLNRVDVRRMYTLGVLDREGVYKSYLDLGYSPDNAELMTQFTVKYESGQDKGLTKEAIIKAYIENFISEDEVLQLLGEIDYKPEAAEMILQLAAYDKYNDQVKDVVNEYISERRLGLYTIDDLKAILDGLDLPATYVNSVIAKEKLYISQHIKLPTKTDIDNWLENNIIDVNGYHDLLIKLGYQEEDIQRYIILYNKDATASFRKFLPVTTYENWYVNYVITEDVYRNILKAMKIPDAEIDAAIKAGNKKRSGTGV